MLAESLDGKEEELDAEAEVEVDAFAKMFQSTLDYIIQHDKKGLAE